MWCSSLYRLLSLVSHYMVISPDEKAVTGLEDRPGVGPHLCGMSLAQIATTPPSSSSQSA